MVVVIGMVSRGLCTAKVVVHKCDCGRLNRGLGGDDSCVTLVTIPVGLWLSAIAVRDARTRRITNTLLWPGVVAVAGMGVTSPAVIAAGLIAASPYLLAWLLRQCGGGDVKLALIVGGLVADWATALLVTLLAAVLSTIAALVARSPSLPHGPALVGAAAFLLAITR